MAEGIRPSERPPAQARGRERATSAIRYDRCVTDRIAKLEKLLALDPSDAFVLYGLATEHAKAGAVDVAMAYFDRCLTADPNYCYAYYHKARVLSEHERMPEAVQTLRDGLVAARRAGDAKAMSEMQTLLDTLE